MNREYKAPRLTKVGSLEEVTKGNARGSRLDATFPSGTNFGDLTFS